jgi:hypothetical protein
MKVANMKSAPRRWHLFFAAVLALSSGFGWFSSSSAQTVPVIASMVDDGPSSPPSAANGLITPNESASVGDSLSINGSNFGTSGYVSIVPLTSHTQIRLPVYGSWGNSITVTIPLHTLLQRYTLAVHTLQGQTSRGVPLTIVAAMPFSPPKPHIDWVTPRSAKPGDIVTVVCGNCFQATLRLTPATQSTPAVSMPAAGITRVQLPSSLPIGLYDFQLRALSGQLSNAVPFQVVWGAPAITRIAGVPTLGQTITITGSGFENTQGSGYVHLIGAGVPDIYVRDIGVSGWSDQEIRFTLSAAGGTYQIQVHTDGNGDSAPIALTVAPPSSVSVENGITALHPLEQPLGVLTQRYNNQRTGANLQEQVLSTQAVGSPDFQELYTIAVPGQVYAQPLVVPQVTWSDGTIKDVLIIATMTNQIFAFQVDDAIVGPAFKPILLWQTTIAPPVPANFMPLASSAMGRCAAGICWPSDDAPSTPAPLPPVGKMPTFLNGLGFYNINPSIGIVSTPVVDEGSGVIYVAFETMNNGSVRNDIAAVDLHTGRILRRATIGVTPNPGGGLTFASVAGSASDGHNGRVIFNQSTQMARPALLLQDVEISPGTHRQILYVAFGSRQDTRPWHGWIFSYDPRTFELDRVWCSTPNGMGGSIWQAGNGIAAGDDGSIYVMTGNGDEDPEGAGNWQNSINSAKSNFAEHFMQLDPDLFVEGSFMPPNALQMDANNEDMDLGSSGPLLLPEPSNENILIGGGKDGRLFVLDTSVNLGMRQIFQAAKPADTPPFNVVLSAADHHIHGAPVAWHSSLNGMNVYVWPERDFLREFHWNDNTELLECKNSFGVTEACRDGDSPMHESTMQTPVCSVGLFGCYSMPGGILSISADGNAAGSGVVWASMPTQEDALNNIVPGTLRALNADDITKELWNTDMNPARDGRFMFAKYTPPVVANGRVYMATFGSIPNAGEQSVTGGVNVYGLRQWAKLVWDDLEESGVRTMKPGQRFTDHMVFQNVGTTVWKFGAYRLGAQSPQDNSTWGTNRVDLPTVSNLSSTTVSPGQFITCSLQLVAPTAPGTYVYQWRMEQENVEWFGDFTPAIAITVAP